MTVAEVPGCRGCAMYQDGRQGFVPDELVDGPVTVIAQNPGADEERGQRVTGYEAGRPLYEPCAPAPLTGKTGYELTRTFLPAAGLQRGVNVNLCNLLKCRWQGFNDMPPEPILSQAVAHCTKAHLRIPASTKLVVAMGAYAAAWTQCPGSVTAWRGYCYDSVIADEFVR